jgi:hypothetical protein
MTEVGPVIVDSEHREESAKIDLSQRIAALKRRKAIEPRREPLFTYEEDEPLKLVSRPDNPD